MNRLNSMLAVALLALTFTACKKDTEDPIIVVPPSDGSTLTLNGIAGSEDGASAANSVYVDFSADKQTAVLRSSWDLGFYSGAEFKVILNATKGSSVTKIAKTDLNAVTEADLVQANLTIGLGTAAEAEFAKLDDPREANILNKTAITTISATDSENSVYLLNTIGGSHSIVFSVDNVYKIRVVRKGTGYTLQYAKLKETTFKTLDVTKSTDNNYSFVSLAEGKTVSVEPAKANWDIVWTWSLYHGGTYVYGYSDLVFTNHLGGATVAQVLTSTKSYAAFSEADVAGLTFSSNRDIIGSGWRATTGTIGVKTDRFYVVKDASGNVYKLKFVSFHASDSGTRGKPVIEYKLVKKG